MVGLKRHYQFCHVLILVFRKFYVADNLQFYTTLQHAYLQLLSARSPASSILVSLSRNNAVDAAPVLGGSSTEDLSELKALLSNVYTRISGLQTWIVHCEAALTSSSASYYLNNSSLYGESAPMFYGGGSSGMDEDVVKYQPLLRQNYQQLELAGYTAGPGAQHAPTATSALLPQQYIFPLGVHSLGAPVMTQSLQNLPASIYQSIFFDGDASVVKKVIKKLLIISVAQEAWLRRHAKDGRRRSGDSPTKASTTQEKKEESTVSWLISTIIAGGAESQEQAVEQLAVRVRAQRETITTCIQLLESVFQVHQILNFYCATA
jgi:hypothetical protein